MRDIWQQISSEDINTELGSEQEAAGWKSGFNTKQNLLVSGLKDSTVKTKLNLYEQLFSSLPKKDLVFSWIRARGQRNHKEGGIGIFGFAVLAIF